VHAPQVGTVEAVGFDPKLGKYRHHLARRRHDDALRPSQYRKRQRRRWSVQRINEQWNEQPKLIDQAAQAHRDLTQGIDDAVKLQGEYNALIAKLQQQKPPGWQDQVAQLEKSRDALGGIIAAAKAAGPVIDDGLLKPLREYGKQAEQQKAIDEALLAGDQDRANALRTIADLEEKIGPLTAQQKQDVLDTVAAERKRSFELQRQDQLISRVARSAGVVQDSLTGGIEAFLKNPTDIKGILAPFKAIFADFRQNFARSISEALLGGDLSSNIEQALRAKSDPLGAAGSDLTGAAGDLTSAASDLTSAASTLASSGSGGGAPSPGQIASTPTAYLPGALLSSGIGGGGYLSLFGQIAGNTNTAATASTNAVSIQQHQADMQNRSALLSNPEQYYNLIGSNVGQSIDKFFGGGKFFEGIGSKLGTIMQGVQLGQMSGQVARAARQALPGQRFQHRLVDRRRPWHARRRARRRDHRRAAGRSRAGSRRQKKESRRQRHGVVRRLRQLSALANTKGDTPTRKQGSSKRHQLDHRRLESLAQQLGVVIDASKGSVSIGIQGDDYRVDTTGLGRTNKNIPGVLNFGSDEQGAVEAAIKEPHRRRRPRAHPRRHEEAAPREPLDSVRITKAIKFENVFKELKQYTDPVGAAIDDLDQQFNELRRIFAEAGASAEEYAQLEELYAFKRADAIKAATQQLDSTLTQLLHDLTYSGDTGLSLKTRQQNALAQLAPFQQQIASGQPIDQEAFAQVVQSLLQIEREMYGSTATYFNMLSMLTQLTQQAISNAGQPVTVPAVTGTPMTPTSSPTTPTSYPVPTGTPSGSPITAPAVPPNVAAANDNYATAQQIIATINKQTQDLIAAGLDQAKMTTAVQTGVTNALTLLAANSNDTEALTTAVQTGNDKIVGALMSLIGISSQQNTLMQAGFNRISGNSQGTVGIAGEVPYWEAPGAGMYFSEWAG
jgi:hypothetical protein